MGPLSLLGGFKVIIYRVGGLGEMIRLLLVAIDTSQLRGGKECVRLFGLLLKGIKAPLHH